MRVIVGCICQCIWYERQHFNTNLTRFNKIINDSHRRWKTFTPPRNIYHMAHVLSSIFTIILTPNSPASLAKSACFTMATLNTKPQKWQLPRHSWELLPILVYGNTQKTTEYINERNIFSLFLIFVILDAVFKLKKLEEKTMEVVKTGIPFAYLHVNVIWKPSKTVKSLTPGLLYIFVSVPCQLYNASKQAVWSYWTSPSV